MGMYSRFLKSDIDFSPLGLSKGDNRSDYFCTPRGAKIIGWAGVDGIHYCFLQGFGQMVFAVSPMNCPGEYVHPIAASIKDLLMLLLSCGSFDCLEQAWGWSQETFDNFISEYPPTPEQQAVLDAIRAEFGVTPMEEPFAYLKNLSAEFDYGRIRYNQEYYEIVPDALIPPWEVSYHGGYWGAEGTPGKEIFLGKEFQWSKHRWQIQAVYSCPEGIVLDFCIPVSGKDVEHFLNKWYPILQENPNPAGSLRHQIDSENPLKMPSFHPILILNGQEIHAEGSCGMSWIPTQLLPEEAENRIEAEDLMDHYGLDAHWGWIFQRARFPWEQAVEIENLTLQLQSQPETFYGTAFPTPAVGEQIAITHPVTGTVHTLIVHDVSPGSFDKFPVEGIEEWPQKYLSLEYTLSPDLSNHQFTLRDTSDSDRPRLKPNPTGPFAGAASIGIIGGADGPTALIFSRQEGPHPHGAISSLHYELPEQVIWQPEFREKLVEDVTITLI